MSIESGGVVRSDERHINDVVNGYERRYQLNKADRYFREFVFVVVVP